MRVKDILAILTSIDPDAVLLVEQPSLPPQTAFLTKFVEKIEVMTADIIVKGSVRKVNGQVKFDEKSETVVKFIQAPYLDIESELLLAQEERLRKLAKSKRSRRPKE